MTRASILIRPWNSRRRGSMYVAVLGVSVLVMTIGLSALMANRIELRKVTARGDVVRARLAAGSMIEVALARMAADANWRSTYAHNVWTAEEEYHGVKVCFKIVDQVDTDLAGDPTHSVRIYGKATAGEAVRVCSALAGVTGTANLLSNPGVEDGITPWTSASVPGGGTLTSDTTVQHGGAASLLVSNLPLLSPGAGQNVTGKIENGKTYYTEAWVKSKAISTTMNVVLVLDTTLGTQSTSFTRVFVSSSWQKLSGTLTPVWTGTLQSAYWHVSMNLQLSGFNIDDALLNEGTKPIATQVMLIAGSWRREPAS